jgi:hypothetical protein
MQPYHVFNVLVHALIYRSMMKNIGIRLSDLLGPQMGVRSLANFLDICLEHRMILNDSNRNGRRVASSGAMYAIQSVHQHIQDTFKFDQISELVPGFMSLVHRTFGV